MKTTRTTLALLAAVAAVMSFAAMPAQAAEANFSYGIVDMSKVLEDTDAAKDVFKQLDARRKEYQEQIAKEDEALNSLKQELSRQRETLSQEEFRKKGQAFEDKFVDGQKMVQERRQILDKAFNDALRSLRIEAARVVAEIAKEKNYAAVFTQDAVMISAPELDMTDAVIAGMNKKVKKMKVNWPSADDAGKKGKKK